MGDISFDLTDNSGEFKAAMGRGVEKALEAIGLQAEGYAKLKCPVDTGRLRNSIAHTTDAGEKAAYIGTNVEYAAYVEFGTSRMAAQPYLKPAVTDHTDEYERIAETMIKSELP